MRHRPSKWRDTAVFLFLARQLSSASRLLIGASCLEELFYIADRNSVDRATELFGEFGMMAIDEAAARSQRYRELGNAVRFCEWRQIERLITLLSQELPVGTVH